MRGGPTSSLGDRLGPGRALYCAFRILFVSGYVPAWLQCTPLPSGHLSLSPISHTDLKLQIRNYFPHLYESADPQLRRHPEQHGAASGQVPVRSGPRQRGDPTAAGARLPERRGLDLHPLWDLPPPDWIRKLQADLFRGATDLDPMWDPPPPHPTRPAFSPNPTHLLGPPDPDGTRTPSPPRLILHLC